MASVATQAVMFLLLISPSLFSGDLGRASSLSFFYNFSDPASFSLGDLFFEGDAYVGDGCIILAKEQLTGDNTLRAGRVSYRHPVHLLSSVTGKTTGFSASFAFVINGSQSYKDTGGGLAFFVAPYTSRMPLNSGGGYLGLFNSTTATGGDRIVAVEMDTHGDLGWDPATHPHISVDFNTLHSGKNRYMVVDNLADGVPKILQVDYSDVTRALIVTLRDSTNGHSVTLETTVDLRRFLPQEVVMGFSAATGVSESGLHRLLWWSFDASANSSASSPVSGTPGPRAQKSCRSLVVLASVIGAALFAVTASVVAVLCCLSRRTMRPHLSHSGLVDLGEAPCYQLRFSYEQLLESTNNFSKKQMLSESTYRGVLKDSGVPVVIKKLKAKSEWAIEEYIHKLESTERIRHKNLVQLLGWCRQGDYLYLVYQYVDSRSLHYHLFDPAGTFLTWPMRYKIVLGTASSLQYLHTEYDIRLIHRNIKSSNVLLDLSYAKLGNFGSLRNLIHDDDEGSRLNAQAVLPASPGYVDPEFITRKASTASDVYSFGIVLLEIACGRPPIIVQDQGAPSFIVDSVWELNETGAVLDAADARLNGDRACLAGWALVCAPRQRAAAVHQTSNELRKLRPSGSQPSTEAANNCGGRLYISKS